MACQLVQDDVGHYPGMTLFTGRHASCTKPTAIYLPAKHAATGTTLDVVIWLHGFYVKDAKFIFHGDPAQVRDQVRDSNKDVVLIAPFLGFEYATPGGHAGHYSVKDLATAKWGERYLDEILAAIRSVLNPDSSTPYQLRKLVIACHSGGGNGMRNLVGTLGKYRSSLAGCWGFDCLYGASATPDDATFWFEWARGPSAAPLEIIYGPSTLPQSVKLDLMARGWATADGNRADPRRAPLANVNVNIGHYDAFPAFGQMVKVNDLSHADVDGFMIPPSAAGTAGRGPGKPHGEFLQQAIANVRKSVPFPQDIHYMIARNGFRSRLGSL